MYVKKRQFCFFLLRQTTHSLLWTIFLLFELIIFIPPFSSLSFFTLPPLLLVFTLIFGDPFLIRLIFFLLLLFTYIHTHTYIYIFVDGLLAEHDFCQGHNRFDALIYQKIFFLKNILFRIFDNSCCSV
jgi:hypothetical protein